MRVGKCAALLGLSLGWGCSDTGTSDDAEMLNGNEEPVPEFEASGGTTAENPGDEPGETPTGTGGTAGEMVPTGTGGTDAPEGTGGTTEEPPVEPVPKGPLKIVWKNTSTVTINTGSGDFNYDVDWENDGLFDEMGITGTVSHSYDETGDHTVAIEGQFPHMTGNCDIDIIQWGNVVWGSFRSTFDRCSGTTISATDAPDLSQVTDMSWMFARSGVEFGPSSNIGDWDTSNVTNMSNLFRHSSGFNQDISGWDTSSVTDMSLAFWKAFAFNQDIGGWDTSSVTNMRIMFQHARSFNQDLGAWDIAKVNNMENMLGTTAMDTENYDATLFGWASQSDLVPRTLGAPGRTYCDAADARDDLSSAGWTIEGDSLECD